MKLKDLKKILDKLTPDQLEQKLLYNSQEHSISGEVFTVKRAPENLYYTGDDDPSELYTRKQLVEMGLDKEEIEECVIEIPKGFIVVELSPVEKKRR